MKTRIPSLKKLGMLALLAGLLASGIAHRRLITPAHAATVRPGAAESSLTVHEWGTFTSITGNDGQALPWLPLTGSTDLPGFVEHFRNAGFKLGLRGTVRMETPVLYFYPAHDMTVSVHVAFSQGLITEWYPHALVGPAQSIWDATLYQSRMDGSIAWDSVALERGPAAAFPRDARSIDNAYYAARETSAASVRVSSPGGEQHEKFLFYRGVSVFPVPISAKCLPDGSVLVNNPGRSEIGQLIRFERRGDRVGYRISNGLGIEALLDPPQLTSSVEELSRDLEEILVARGLYRDEAQAMLKTWRSSWFEEGSRLFYVLPSSFVDNILPLTIEPRPAETVRVFVGRLELITPATEKAIQTALASHDNATLKKYSRFQEPIFETMKERHPDQERQLNKALDGFYQSVFGARH